MSEERAAARIAMYAATAMAAITTVTFGLALFAVPISGSNCPSDCIEYPYLDTLDRFPRDYVWMYFAIGLVVAYLIFATALNFARPRSGSAIAGQVAVGLAIVVVAVLAPTYFVQFSVVPSSLSAGQTDGISLLTQYNPHGIFIALEEIGYLLMSFSFLFLIPLIPAEGFRAKAVRWIFGAGFVASILALVAIAIAFGFDRQDRFEVVVISVTWLVLIVNGVLVALVFRSRLRTGTDS